MPIRPFFVALLALGTGAAAQPAPPLSAIEWLSDSIASPAAMPRPRSGTPGEPGVAATALPDPVEVMPLDAPPAEIVGLMTPAEAGLPDGLWRGSDPATVRRILSQRRGLHLPTAQSLLQALVVVDAAPPEAADASDFLIARVDALLGMGALDLARALLDAAEPETPENFRRWFDIALLTGQENRACQRMRDLPKITPTYPARIFCLARGGDWMAAALTLDSAEALDVVSAAETERLNRFLDDLHETGLGLPPPNGPSPLDFAIYEAIGEPLRTTSLPLAFAHADLRDNTGWKARIEAAERLARAGAIAPERLWSVYHEREPAASGGIWDRVAAIQVLDAALTGNNPRALAAALTEAWAEMQSAGLADALARRHGSDVANLSLDGQAAQVAYRMGLLSDAGIAAATSAETRDDRFLAALAQGELGIDAAEDPVERAVAQGFAAEPPARISRLIAEDRAGEAIVLAVDRMDEGATGNLDALKDGIAMLRALGLTPRAIDAAIEVLVLEFDG